MKPRLLALAALLALTCDAARAAACTIAQPQTHLFDPTQGADLEPPILVVIAQHTDRDQVGGCESREDDGCPGLGRLTIEVGTSDAGTDPAGMGYEVEVLDGRLPGGPPRRGALDYFEPGEITFLFDDVDQAISVDLEIRAVDRNGNRSAPQIVRFRDPGGDGGGGCSLGLRSQHGSALLIALAAVIACQRRRRRRV